MTRERCALVISICVAATLLAIGATATTPTAGQLNNSTYYSNHSGNVSSDMDAWMEGREEPTLDNFTHYATRVGGFYVGQGEAAGDGEGAAGAMILSLVLFGALLRGMQGRQVGPVAGVVLAIALAFGLAAAALAPHWVYVVGMFGIGLILAMVIMRILR